ncbi:hypothetical protein ACIQXV_26145 [Neobacillus sp. NPDC097160]|uniref:hypothetical protein n=1 Tax=Neobacillus sp. NPDC097160 TaxID=3364298 RepID=UPI00382004FA
MEYQTMFYGGLSGAALSLILAIIVFIKLNISEVFEDVTGFSVRKWVKKLQASSRSKQEQNHKPITREIQPRHDVELEVAVSGSVEATELLEAVDPSSGSVEATELLEAEAPSIGGIESTELLDAKSSSHETTELLSEADTEATELLSKESPVTEILTMGNDETELLSDETELLSEATEETTVLTGPASESQFIKERDVVIVHTNATI